MKTATLALIGCVSLVGVGVVHGVWTDRWNDGSDLVAAAERLDKIPLSVGDWEGKRVEHTRDARSGLAGAATYQFTNKKTGKAVTVFLACGRPGPVSVHTPEVCYAGAGYEVERSVRFTSGRAGLQNQTFFTSRLVKKRSADMSAQRIFWAWNGGNGWEVSDSPRFAFSDQRVLHKMYVIREAGNASEPLENDPCVDLMEVLVPKLESCLVGVPPSGGS